MQRGGAAAPVPRSEIAAVAPPVASALASAPAASAPAAPPAPTIDRLKPGGHHRLEEYANRGREPPDELEMYTWSDETLRELAVLIQQERPAARRPNCRLEFAFVYPDRRGRNVMRQVGSVHSTRQGPDDNKSLRELSFQTGDFLDVAIY